MEDIRMNIHNTGKNSRNFRKRNMILSILLCIICAVALVVPQQSMIQEPYNFESAAGIDLESAQSTYAEHGDNAALYRLTLAHCRKAYLLGDNYDGTELCACGRELYRRAKAGTLDLTTIGDTDDTAAMLALLRSYGVTPATS